MNENNMQHAKVRQHKTGCREYKVIIPCVIIGAILFWLYK